MAVVVGHADADWATNSRGYRFLPQSGDGLIVSAAKHPDGTLAIQIGDRFGNQCEFLESMPRSRQLTMAFSWWNGEVSLYLNDQFIRTQPFRRTTH